jgi:predicted secreted hydrolase
LDLRLVPAKPFVIHGENGVHQKADIAGQASHYITFTRLQTDGILRWRGKEYFVTGLGWMDHEFGSDYLSDSQAGWDWFAIQLESGHDLMLYQLRNKDGSANTHSIGSIVDPKGTLTPIRGSDFVIQQDSTWKSPKSGGTYPMGWTIRVPGEGGTLTIMPAFTDQEMVMEQYTNTAYWEGAVTIEGTWQGAATAGRGYVELVGYAGDFDLL